jgi:ion channel-forming bestrophin family protein
MEAHKRITPIILLKFNWGTILFIATLGFATWLASVLITYKESTYLFPGLTVYGTILSLYLAFKTNESYNRWWEARILWGELLNTSRIFARQVITLITLSHTRHVNSPEELRKLHRTLIYRQIGYANAIRMQLRGKYDWDQLASFIPQNELLHYQKVANVPTQINQKQGEILRDIFDKENSKDFRHIQIDKTLNEFYRIQGGCERIKNTIFPQLYNYFTMAFVWLFVILLIISLADEFDLQTLIVRSIVGYVFITLEKLGRSLKDPFEGKSQDIPVSALCRTIEIDLKQQLGENDVPKPERPVNGVLL